MVLFFMKPEGGGLDLRQAIQRADGELNGTTPEEDAERIASWNVDQITWFAIDRMFKQNPDYAQQIWEEIKDQAAKDFTSGHYAAELFERASWMKSPWKRARFIAVRDGFIAEYKRRGAIEISMIDMLAVNFFLWMHWTEALIQRTTTHVRHEPPEWVRHRAEEERGFPRDYEKGYWDLPYISQVEAEEEAARMADRFRRAYQSQLRAIRDWRRYSTPLTINNPKQVNIAADGGQQVNVQDND
jgi:hypothetical protein